MPPRTPQPPKKNYPGTAALRPNDPNSPQNPSWGLPKGQGQPRRDHQGFLQDYAKTHVGFDYNPQTGQLGHYQIQSPPAQLRGEQPRFEPMGAGYEQWLRERELGEPSTTRPVMPTFQEIGQAAGSFGRSDELQPFLNQLAKGEGVDDEGAREHGFASGYDVPFNYGRDGKPVKPLSQMSLREIYALQDQMVATQRAQGRKGRTPVGKYQFIKDTLQRLQRAEGLSDDTKFDTAIQERFGRALLRDAKLDDYRAGRISFDQLHRNLKVLWDSVEDPKTGITPQGGTTKKQLHEFLDPLGPKSSPRAPRGENK